MYTQEELFEQEAAKKQASLTKRRANAQAKKEVEAAAAQREVLLEKKRKYYRDHPEQAKAAVAKRKALKDAMKQQSPEPIPAVVTEAVVAAAESRPNRLHTYVSGIARAFMGRV